MIGSEGVTRHLLEKLKVAMPGKLIEMRQRYGADARTLPDVQRWYAHDIDELEVGGFPAILVTETESIGQIANREVTFGIEADEYTFEYVLRVYLWAMGDNAGDTALLAKRLVLAVEEICLYQKLVYSDDEGEENAQIDPKFLKHSYSDAAVDGAQQILNGAYVEIHIQTRELLKAPPPIGQLPIETEIQAVRVDTSLL